MEENSSLNKENKNSEAETPEIFAKLPALARERAVKAFRSRGRPTKYAEDACINAMIAGFAQGWTVAQVCAELNISRECFYNWVRTKPIFSDAYKKHRVLAQQHFDDIAMQNIEMPTRDFNFLLFESCYKRRFHVTEHATVELPDGFADASYPAKLDLVFEALSSGDITPEQAQTLITTIKTAVDVDALDELEQRLYELENKD
jgi:hypothetical protein